MVKSLKESNWTEKIFINYKYSEILRLFIHDQFLISFAIFVIDYYYGYLINVDCTQGSSIWSLKDSN